MQKTYLAKVQYKINKIGTEDFHNLIEELLAKDMIRTSGFITVQFLVICNSQANM